MRSVALLSAIFGIFVLFGSQAEAATRCKKHTDCGDLEVCNKGTCESAIGRVYKVSVLSAKIVEKKRSGDPWDAGGGLPDVDVIAYFPNTSATGVVLGKRQDTCNPSWNVFFEVTVTAAGQELWFCFVDRDAMDDDPIHTAQTGNSYCKGYGNIVDFIRAGSQTWSNQGEVAEFKVAIQRK